MFRKFQATAKKNSDYRKQFDRSRKIDIETNSDSDLDMASPEQDSQNASSFTDDTNYQQLRLFLDIIPTYSGEPCAYHNFVDACNETLTQYGNEPEHVKKLIFRAIMGKLRGKALTLISSRHELNTWDKVQNVLKTAFTDQRSFTCLLNDLHNLKPGPKEASYDFGVRCQHARSLIFSSINNDCTLTQEAKQAQNSNIEKLIVTTFLKHLNPQVQTVVRLKQPKNLEEAMTYLTEEENFLSLINDGRKSFYQQPSFSKASMPPKYGQQQYINRPIFQTSVPQRFSTPRPQTFPRQPVNVAPRQVPQYFPSTQQVFGKSSPTNVWKPRNQTPTHKPTPMSVVTKQLPAPKFTFQPQSRPTFHAEELYNTTTNQPNYNEPSTSISYTEWDSELQLENQENNYEEYRREEMEQNYAYLEENDETQENFFTEASGMGAS